MAQLKDTLIQGSARVTDTLYANNLTANAGTVNTFTSTALTGTTMSTDLLNIYSVDASTSVTTEGINFYSQNVLKNHIGGTSALGLYSYKQIYLRPGQNSFSSDYGVDINYVGMTPNGTMTLGNATKRWDGVYASTGDFSSTLNTGSTITAGNTTAGAEIDIKAISNAGSIYLYSAATATGNRGIYGYNAQGTGNPILTVNQDSMITGGGTIKWYYTLSSTSRYIGHYLRNPAGTLVGETWYDTGDATNISSGIWNWRSYSPNSTANTSTTGYYETYHLPAVTKGLTASKSYRILTTKNDLDFVGLGTALASGDNIDTGCNIAGTYYSSSSTVSGALTGTVFSTGAGFKLHTIVGYRAKTLRQFGGAADHRLYYRSSQDTGATWTKWYQLVKLPSGDNNKTFADLGSATQPVYVNADGLIMACTAIKALAYKDSLATSDIPTISITDKTSGTLTVARGGTGVTSFTNDYVIVSTGTTQTLVSRGLKVIGDAAANTTISTADGKTLDIAAGSTFYLDAPANTSHIFRKDTTEYVRINTKGMLQVNSSVTQSSHRLLVNGDSAFTGKLSFVGTPAATLTENASIAYNSTSKTIDSKFAWNTIITGTGTAGVTYVAASGNTAATPGKPALWKFNLGIATPAEGTLITIKVPVAGHASGVFVSTDNGTTYYPISVNGTTRLTTHYAASQIVTLAFLTSGGTNTVYPVAGATATTNITGNHWVVLNYYDANTNTLMRTYALSLANEFPVLAGSLNTSGSVPTHTSSYKDLYGIITNVTANRPTINISTGVFSAPAGITTKGDINLQAASNNNDTPDIVWKYYNGQEKSKIWTADTYAAAAGPYYRCYNSSGTALYNGNLVIGGLSDMTSALAIAAVDPNNPSIMRYTSKVLVQNNQIAAGLTGDTTTGESQVNCRSAAGQIYFYSTASTTGDRGIFLYNAANSGNFLFTVNQNNQISQAAPFQCVVSIRDLALVKGTNPSANGGPYMQFLENGTGTAAGNRLALIYDEVNTDGANSFGLYAYKYESGSTAYANVNLTISRDGTDKRFSAGSNVKIYGAVWNDYAEYRKQLYKIEPGRVVYDLDDGYILPTDKRLIPGAQVVSDTFGFAIGETEEYKTPLAVSGRVLVYTYRDRYEYHAGDAVCSAPNGTVDIMTREEIKEYPDAIIGIVSEIPNYTNWGSGNVPVNGRIWIKVR